MSATATPPVITFFNTSAQRPSPEIEGEQFAGVATFSDGSTARISVQMTSQLLSNVTGTALLDDTRPGASRYLFVLRGSATRGGVFSLSGVATGNRTAMVSGMMSRNGGQAAGQFIINAAGKLPESGTFTASRQ